MAKLSLIIWYPILSILTNHLLHNLYIYIYLFIFAEPMDSHLSRLFNSNQYHNSHNQSTVPEPDTYAATGDTHNRLKIPIPKLFYHTNRRKTFSSALVYVGRLERGVASNVEERCSLQS